MITRLGKVVCGKMRKYYFNFYELTLFRFLPLLSLLVVLSNMVIMLRVLHHEVDADS